MKKIYAILLAALTICAVSCQQGPLDNETPITGEEITFTATLETAPTTPSSKTTLGDEEWIDGKKIRKSYWTKVDEITVNGVKLQATLPEGQTTSATATFTGVVTPNPDGAKYVATYGKFSATQTAVLNNYDPAVVELRAESNDNNLAFQNLTALLRIDVQGDDNGTDINSVTFTADEHVVTLTGTKLQGVYYMAIQPGNYTGFEIKINESLVKKNISGAFIPSASNTYNVGHVKHSNVKLVGNDAATHQGKDKEWGNGGIEMIDCGNDKYVLYNHTFNEGAEFKILADGIWYGCNKDGQNIKYNTDWGTYKDQANLKPTAGTCTIWVNPKYEDQNKNIKRNIYLAQ